MPSYCLKYNPDKDWKKVSPVGALDLHAAYDNNAVPADLHGVESRYNGIDDPNSIVGRVTDVFDAEQRAHQLRTAKRPESTKTGDSEGNE